VDLQGTQQVAGLAEPGQHQGPALGELLGQLLGRCQSVHAGQVDVDHGDIGSGPQRGGHDLVAPLQLGNHLHVVFQGQQRHQGATDHVHVLGDQHPDHPTTSPGTSTDSRNRPSGVCCAEAEPDNARARSANPASPVPSATVGDAPSFTMSSRIRPACCRAVIEQVSASLWRRMLVTPSRTAQPSTSSTGRGSCGRSASMWALIPAAASSAAAPWISAW
jgi:hypothetical protein